jgi:hypothetical protein
MAQATAKLHVLSFHQPVLGGHTVRPPSTSYAYTPTYTQSYTPTTTEYTYTHPAPVAPPPRGGH